MLCMSLNQAQAKNQARYNDTLEKPHNRKEWQFDNLDIIVFELSLLYFSSLFLFFLPFFFPFFRMMMRLTWLHSASTLLVLDAKHTCNSHTIKRRHEEYCFFYSNYYFLLFPIFCFPSTVFSFFVCLCICFPPLCLCTCVYVMCLQNLITLFPFALFSSLFTSSHFPPSPSSSLVFFLLCPPSHSISTRVR